MIKFLPRYLEPNQNETSKYAGRPDKMPRAVIYIATVSVAGKDGLSRENTVDSWTPSNTYTSFSTPAAELTISLPDA